MRRIDGATKSVRDLLSGKKYTVDYYQREYKWEDKQVQELLTDLAGAFQEDYQSDHDPRAVRSYGHYFLGSVILSQKEGHTFIVDGQQRITTLTLLLIYLHNLQQGVPGRRVKIDDLIYSEQYGERSFNIDVPERRPALEALFAATIPDEGDHPESVETMVARYRYLADHFPADLKERALPYFVDWLIENVLVVEITAYADEDAYTIFETMNDRGLSLTPLDMLKGYVLNKITEPREKERASKTWKARVEAVAELGKEEDADALRAWLRGRHATSIRERRKNARPGDFDLIGTEFHRWVRDNEARLDLHTSRDFVRFVERDLTFYTRQFETARRAARTLTPGLEPIFYNAQYGLTLQYPFLLGTLEPDDGAVIARRKMRVAAQYVEILLTRRIWNFRSIDYNTMQYRMFLEIGEARGKDLPTLAAHLRGRLEGLEENFATEEWFELNQRNRYYIHRILARMTAYLEEQSGLPSRYAEYVAEGPGRYEVEHIWANMYEQHADEFAQTQDFATHRNLIGDLLLLPKRFNASYGALPYAEKLGHYAGQNLLARSLLPAAYDHNPGFRQYLERSGLPFRPHPEFRKADLWDRQHLYQRLAEEIWSPARLTDGVP